MIQLSAAEAAAIEPVLQRLGQRAQRRVDLEGLVERWQRLVEEVERGYALTGYDYVNDLAARDMLDEVASHSPPSLRDRLTSTVLDTLDDRFRAVSRESVQPLRLSAPERPRWWWYRVPYDLTGALAADLLTDG
jgi:hypothetical protein